ncbi:MAG: UbiX family flavin prenyltransferase [Alistipes sp.]|jgi:4-hydroxy-3-polyprenylbenzoate decarboxylase|nr:UbiX family flavin prenyltransferase [Alistipes sp.]
MKIIVAVTGASGSIYGRQVVEGLLASHSVESIGLIVSRRGAEVAAWEGVELPWGATPPEGAEPAGADPRVERFDNDDMFASVASGSASWDAMVVVPCSMGCVGRIAAGVSSDLIARAADVMLKEGRPLMVVPREAPLNLIHLRNLTTLAEAGAIVLPASPSFYSRPTTLDDVCSTVTDRILARLGIVAPRYEWGK